MANVTSTHPDYLEYTPLWELARASVKGQAAIKAGGERWLPKPSGASKEKYAAYLNRAVYSAFTARVHEGLYGQVFSKKPEIIGAESEIAKNFLANVDKSGNSLIQFVSDLINDTLKTNRSAILVDHDPVPEGTDVNQKEHDGYRAFLRWYKAEDIEDWDKTVINNQKKISLVKLRENYSVRIDDFTSKTIERRRVLKLENRGNEQADNWVYVVDVWELIKDDKNKDGKWEIVDHFEPELDGKKLDFIPIFFLPADDPEESMLLPIAYENIGHYQLDADHKNNIHLTTTPALFCENVELAMKRTVTRETDKDGKVTETETLEPVPLTLGGDVANFVNQINEGFSPRIHYVEPTGNGAAASLAAKKDSKENIEALGGDLIKKKKGVETAEAARMHKSTEISVLGSFALDCSIAITGANRLALRWNGLQEVVANEFDFILPTDYETEIAGAEKVQQGINLFRDGLLSKDTFFTDYLNMSEEEAQEEAKQITQEESSVYKENNMEGEGEQE